MAWLPYDAYITRLVGAGTKIDVTADTIKLLLLTSSYTPNRATHAFRNDLGANEVSGTGYTAGGLAVISPTVVISSNDLTYDSADWVIAQNAGGFTTARYAVLAKILGGASSADPLMMYYDLGSNRGNVAGALTLATPVALFQINAP